MMSEEETERRIKSIRNMMQDGNIDEYSALIALVLASPVLLFTSSSVIYVCCLCISVLNASLPF